MTAKQFKDIRDYLTANRFQDQKWSQESIGKALLSTRITVNRWESGETPIPKLVAERVHEMLVDCGLEKVKNELKTTLVSKVHTPGALEDILEKIRQL